MGRRPPLSLTTEDPQGINGLLSEVGTAGPTPPDTDLCCDPPQGTGRDGPSVPFTKLLIEGAGCSHRCVMCGSVERVCKFLGIFWERVVVLLDLLDVSVTAAGPYHTLSQLSPHLTQHSISLSNHHEPHQDHHRNHHPQGHHHRRNGLLPDVPED